MGNNSDIEHDRRRRRRWHYTWEAQSHIPTLRLLIFTTSINPSLECHNLNAKLHSSHSLLLITFSRSHSDHTLSVPIPNVLIDAESPLSFRALEDHIEVKLLLLLPIDHPILSTLNPSEEPQSSFPNVSNPLIMEYDVKNLSTEGEVDFYCKSCSFKLTTSPLRNFVEMPSANWREVADNWFGACCCSFGGISEKLVIRYVNSYTCTQGKCLLSTTSVTLCKDDLAECNFTEGCGQQECYSVADSIGDDGCNKSTIHSELKEVRTSTCCDTGEAIYDLDENSRFGHPENEKLTVNFGCEVTKNEPNHGDFSHSHPDSNIAEDVAITHSCCSHLTSILGDENGEHHSFETAKKRQMPKETMEILGNQKSFLNGFLEDVFMARSSNLSKDIVWHEFTCPHCTSLLGAYPCSGGHTPVDGGVRLFKCYISTDVPVGGSRDIFSKYTMEKMFANQLMKCANDESTFRFVIRDLKTKSPVLQIILLNPDTWSCFGNCSGSEDENPVPKLQFRPIVKVLFSEGTTATESQIRMMEEWTTKNSAENIFMLNRQIQELVGSLISAKDIYPPSCASLQGLILSFLQR